MVDISIHDRTAVFQIEGLDKFWALKGQIEVPLEHITGATVDSQAARGWWHGLRMPGTQIPGVITAGTFYSQGRRVFYDVHDPDNTIVVALDHESYDHLVVEVADPDAEVAKIMSAISRSRS
ncbi:MAG: hypothetical protein M3R65_02540 [Gemmatimonadota bacterium]|nr:hypothetical protein [Gemmatimonadota bacterium]